MKKKIIIAILIIAILSAGVIGLRINNSSTAIELSQTSQGEDIGGIQISQDGKAVVYNGIVGETALETLKKLTDVETTTSDFGEFVTAINGVIADSTKEFWAFYVNGQMGSVGAGEYKAVSGDKIEWKLESF